MKQKIIDHILFMKKHDTEYARYALAQYNASMPWLSLNQAVALALKEAA